MGTEKIIMVKQNVKLPPYPVGFVILCIFSWGFQLVGKIIGISDPHSSWAGVCQLLALPFSIAAAVWGIIFFYRLWTLAQASTLGIKKPSPGKAIGFCFIPFFQFYWLFILYRNLALHLNSLTKYHKVPVKLVTVGCAMVASLILSPIGGIILCISWFSFYKSAKEVFSCLD